MTNNATNTLPPSATEPLQPRRVLAVVAHPDDVEYYCGGTLAAWAGAGCAITLLVVTSGDKGSEDLATPAATLQQQREAEQEASAAVLGITAVRFLRYPDSELRFADPRPLTETIVRQIRRTSPDVVLTHDPLVRFHRQHPDHRVVGQLAGDAAFPLAGVPRCFPHHLHDEGLSPHQPATLLQFGADDPNYFVDIAATLDTKIEALRRHQSQASAFAGGVAERLRWKAETIGAKCGLAAAEEFVRVRVGPTLPEA